MLLIKNSAGFLVGRIAVFDPACTFIRWIEDEMYSFKILAPIKFPKTFNFPEDDMIECPECNTQVKSKNLAKHFLDSLRAITCIQYRTTIALWTATRR